MQKSYLYSKNFEHCVQQICCDNWQQKKNHCILITINLLNTRLCPLSLFYRVLNYIWKSMTERYFLVPECISEIETTCW
jgi:hypothetical protein